MDISTEVGSDGTLRRHIIRGPFDFDELKTYLAQLYAAPGADMPMDALWDLRGADFSAVAATDVQSMMEFVAKRWSGDGKARAALVVENELDYGMSRMYQMMLDGATSNSVAVFRSMDEAERWIRARDA